MKGTLFFLAVAVLASASMTSHAAEDNTGFYVGAGAGIGRIEANTRELGLLPTDTGEQISGNDTFNNSSISSKFFVGWRPIRFFAVELGYFKMHDLLQRECFLDPVTSPSDPQTCAETRDPAGTGASTLSSNTWSIEMPTKGFTGYLVGLYPINQTIDIFAKVGGVFWETDAAGYERVAGGTAPPSQINDDCISFPGDGLLAPKPPSLPVTNNSISCEFDSTDIAVAIGANFNTEGGLSVRTEIEWFDMDDYDKSWLATMAVMYTF